MRGIWRANIDFMDFDFFDFELFESVLTESEVNTSIVVDLSPFTIPSNFSDVLSDGIYDYCYGKMINLKNTERWKRNFLGEIAVFILENGRYLQAYARDVNKNIGIADTSKVESEGEEKSGKAETKKTGNIENNQKSGVQGANEQQAQLNMGATVTVLQNVTTSTNYIGSKNNEQTNSGTSIETGTSSFDKENESNIKMGMENSGMLSDQKNKNVVDTSGTKSPLTVASEESKFTFQKWMEPLFEIIDSYFLTGGYSYD